jgi:hypothetical protein
MLEKIFRRTRNWRHTAALAALLMAAAAIPAGGQEIARQGTFDGRWDVVGKALKIELGESRAVTVVKFEGAVVLEGHQRGLARGFRTECVGMQDQKSGGVGRCVWKDRFDHEIWSEISSDSLGTARRSHGNFVGGTGKFEGIEGEFEFQWVYMIPASEEGPVQGYTTELSGNWKLP